MRQPVLPRARLLVHHQLKRGFTLTQPPVPLTLTQPPVPLTGGIGRIVHQVGYSSGYGSHGAGFAIAALASGVLEGLLFLTAASGFGLTLPALLAGPEL